MPERNAGSKLDEILHRRRQSSGRKVGLVLLLVGIAGLAIWLRFQPEPIPEPVPIDQPPPSGRVESPVTPEPPSPSPPAPTEEPAAAAETPATEVVLPPPEAKPALPPVARSDDWVRERATGLSSRLEFTQWLLGSDLAQRLVVATVNLGEGSSPRKQVPELAPAGAFTVVTDEEGRVLVDPRSYDRYEIPIQVFLSLAPQATADVIGRIAPLLDEAYRELGYPDQRFDQAIASAIRELLGAPVVSGDVELRLKVLTYEYADPVLEDLSSAQKQLLRTGPINVGRIQGKLRKLALALGISEDELPRPSFHDAESWSVDVDAP